MKLSYKLFASYLLVVVIGLIVLSISTAFVAPVNFSQQMTHMGGNLAGMMGQHTIACQMNSIAVTFQISFNDIKDTVLIINDENRCHKVLPFDISIPSSGYQTSAS